MRNKRIWIQHIFLKKLLIISPITIIVSILNNEHTRIISYPHKIMRLLKVFDYGIASNYVHLEIK